LRYRKEQLQDEQARQIQIAEETRRAKVVVFNCPGCGTERKKVTQGHIDDRLAAKSPNWILRCSDCNHYFDLRDSLPELRTAAAPPSRPARSPAPSGSVNKVLSVVVFFILMFIGTYFARVSSGGIGSVFIGYTIGAIAFIVAPILWKMKK
jgi:hypothetical protein